MAIKCAMKLNKAFNIMLVLQFLKTTTAQEPLTSIRDDFNARANNVTNLKP